MYLSKISLRPDAPLREIRKIQADGYRPHMVVWDIMSGGRDNMKRQFLYRLEANKGRPFFYVVSEQPPADDGGVWNIATKPYNPVVHEGDTFSFVLRTNPVRTPSKRPGKQRKRVDVILEARRQLQSEGLPPEQWPTAMQLAQTHGTLWLQQREESCGFSLAASGEDAPVLIVESYEKQRFFKKRENGSSHPVTLSVVDFRGVLTVTDPVLFREKLLHGIGYGKAFGCGLMLVRRAH